MFHRDPTTDRAPARAKPALSIRARVLVLVALAIAPLLFDRIRLLETERAERVAAASQEAISLAHRGIEAQQQIVLAARSIATGMDLEWIGGLGNAVAGRKGMSALLID